MSEQFAQDIAAYRDRHIREAVAAVLDAGYTADTARQVAQIAEWRWVDQHPHLAARIEATT